MNHECDYPIKHNGKTTLANKHNIKIQTTAFRVSFNINGCISISGNFSSAVKL